MTIQTFLLTVQCPFLVSSLGSEVRLPPRTILWRWTPSPRPFTHHHPSPCAVYRELAQVILRLPLKSFGSSTPMHPIVNYM
ncbi:hypothetical protein FA15DRAFT_667987 [Coprinopsis marcescibilis]|uniref:Secreted protein n=1 Tax=Coprinopsis marcescibilis TaxID=230819 RepID=A0A5C3LCE9_COPMA|nr:hypothetical protein FA15DRAFT_667987 [Coprinopsis marcescibilis]